MSMRDTRSVVARREVVPAPDASNILLLAPTSHHRCTTACYDLLVGVEPSTSHLIVVNYLKSIEAWLAEYEQHVPTSPEAVQLINAQRGDPPMVAPESLPSWVARTNTEPGNLTELGVTIGEALSNAPTRQPDGETSVTLCFRSLSILLFYVDVSRACQFLHRITREVEGHGVTAHYHLDPLAFDAKVIAKFKALCDEVIEVEADGIAGRHDADDPIG